tara:strand:+ start:122 stop:286 length:165 start_codon:yes stop_codon:yes gene_type:complete
MKVLRSSTTKSETSPKVFIAAPFGNYLSFLNAISVNELIHKYIITRPTSSGIGQ